MERHGAIFSILLLAACTPTVVPPQTAALAQAPAPRQTVHVALVPSDSRCTVRQGADTFEGVTSGDTLILDRAAVLDITCRKAGFRTTRLRKAPAFDFAMPAGQQMAFPDVITVELQR